HWGSGLSYSSMPSKAWPMVWSTLPLVSPLRVPIKSQVRPIRLAEDPVSAYQTIRQAFMEGEN
ncbi:hypothetical protein NE645_18160, partial [Roseburia hominis]|nr:hypothetical protein [Roseburia hominis]